MIFDGVWTFYWLTVSSLHFVSLPWLGISRLRQRELYVLMCLKLLQGLLGIWSELWCLLGSVIVVVCTASVSWLTSCTVPWLISVWQWSLISRQNCQLLPWSFGFMMYILVSWSVHINNHVLYDHLFLYGLTGLVLGPCGLYFICLWCRDLGWFSFQCCPQYWFPWQVGAFLFLDSLLFTFSFWIISNSHSYPRSMRDINPRVGS